MPAFSSQVLNKKFIKEIQKEINNGEGTGSKITITILLMLVGLTNGVYYMVPHDVECDPNRAPELRSFELQNFKESCLLEKNSIHLVMEYVINGPFFLVVVVIITSRSTTSCCILNNNPSAVFEDDKIKVSKDYSHLLNDDSVNQGIMWTIDKINIIEFSESIINAVIIAIFIIVYHLMIQKYSFEKHLSCSQTPYVTPLKATGGEFTCEFLAAGYSDVMVKANLAILLLTMSINFVHSLLALKVLYHSPKQKTDQYHSRIGTKNDKYSMHVAAAKAEEFTVRHQSKKEQKEKLLTDFETLKTMTELSSD